MYGHEGVARDLTDRLLERLAVRVASVRAERGATALELPDPALIRAYFVPQLDVGKYPAFVVTELDTPTGISGSRGMNAGSPFTTYAYNYPFRIWVWVKGSSYGEVELQLKRYLLAIREALLENLLLAVTETHHAEVMPDSISENFYTPDEDSRQVLGAGFLGVVIKTEEALNPAKSETLVAGSMRRTAEVPEHEQPFTIQHGVGALPTRENPDPNIVPGPPIHSANSLSAAEFDPNDL